MAHKKTNKPVAFGKNKKARSARSNGFFLFFGEGLSLSVRQRSAPRQKKTRIRKKKHGPGIRRPRT
jgi:hypothetical protein